MVGWKRCTDTNLGSKLSHLFSSYHNNQSKLTLVEMQMNKKNFLLQKQLCDEKIFLNTQKVTEVAQSKEKLTCSWFCQDEQQTHSLKFCGFYSIAKLFSQKTKSANFPSSKKISLFFLFITSLWSFCIYLASGVAFWVFALYFVVCNKQNGLNIFSHKFLTDAGFCDSFFIWKCRIVWQAPATEKYLLRQKLVSKCQRICQQIVFSDNLF